VGEEPDGLWNMSGQKLACWRLHTHHVWGAPIAQPAAVVRWFGAMQAQEFVPAKWAIAQRCTHVGDAQVEKLYAGGEILRTHLVRPTWHFVHRDDIRWVREATKNRVHQLNGPYYRQLGVEGITFDRCVKLFTKALKGGNELNRRELAEVLQKGAGIEATGLRMGYILMRAELDGVIVSGSVGGKQPTFAYFEDRVPPQKAMPHDEAVAELTRRYFFSRGPATLKDYVRWSSLTVAEARAGLSMVMPELAQRDIDQRTYFFAKSAAGRRPPSPRIDLIQAYDEYVMSYSESKDVLQSSSPVTSGAVNVNMYLHAVLLDGQVIGHWRHSHGAKDVTVETALYRELTRAEVAAMDAATKRFGGYFGVEGRWTIAAAGTRRAQRPSGPPRRSS